MTPTPTLDHEKCRSKVCLICLRKADGPVNSDQIKKIRNHSNLFNSIQPFDRRVPTGICNGCRTDLNKLDDPKRQLKIPEGFSFTKEVLIPANTRSNSGDSPCQCLICEIGKYKNPFLPHPYYKVPLKKIFKAGVKRKSEPKEEFKWNNRLSVPDNLNILQQVNPRQAEQFAGQVIKKKESSPGGSKYLTQMHGGKPMPVSLGKKVKETKTVFTHDEMEDLATKAHLPQGTMRTFQTFINRKKSCKVQSGLQEELPRRNRLLDDFYKGERLDFVSSDDPKKAVVINRPLVFCENAQELILHICDIRDIDWHEYKIQLFLDGGNDMLKMSCVIKPVDLETNEKAGRKSSGVNQLIPLAYGPKIPENNHNFRVLFEKTGIWNVKISMSLDHKAKNIVAGMQNAAATHPCAECTTPRCDFSTGKNTGETRLVSDLAREYKRYTEDQAKRKDAADYHNVIHQPLFAEKLEEMLNCHVPVRYFLPPSPLHCKLGVVELFHDVMRKIWPEEVDKWVRKSLAKKSDNPKMKFEGNDCNKMLDSLNELPKYLAMVPYKNALSSFREIKNYCFTCADHIDVDLAREKIEKFTYDSIVLFKDFDVSAINKLHACHAHLMEWIEEFELPLGHVDEQTGESSHQDFSKFCQGKLMENIHDDRYLENLRKLVVAYASMHRKSKLCF